MAKDRYGLWSPHRDSSNVSAFQSLLSQRLNESWVWYSDPSAATWWIVDGARSDVAAVTEMLRAERTRESTNGITHGAILATDWTSVSHPIWTFFKVPLKTQLVYNWVDAVQKRMNPMMTSFRGQKFRLRRWPNMSRYSHNLNTAQSMSLTVACAQALKSRMAYTDMIMLVGIDNSMVIDSLLRDALQDGILELSKADAIETARPPSSSLSSLPSPNPTSNHKGWSLVRRLIEKFT